MKKSISLILICFMSMVGVAGDYSILDFGAKGDRITLNTRFIQDAINKAHEDGGGRVIVPKGVFLTGALLLKSGVELHIAKDGILLGSTLPQHYFKINRWKALIIADNESNIGISGKGTIDGQGRKLALYLDSLFYAGEIDSVHYNFVEMRPKYYLRPQLIEFVSCKNIVVRDVTMKNAACWVQTHHECDSILIDNIRIESDAYWNNDGIDIQDCKDVRITNSYVNAADDGICLKSHHSSDRKCENIYIGNCTVRSSASAIKFGTRSHGGFKNVLIENIKVFDTFRSAIAIESVDGGDLEDVIIQNIEAKNTGNALFIRLGQRHTERPGTLKNVLIQNVKVEVSFERPDYNYEIRGPELPFFHNTFPASITGIPNHPIENLVLKNIEVIYPGRGNNGLANMPISRLDDVPEKIDSYPEFSMFGELPAWGFYVRHVNGLVMENVSICIKDSDYRPALVFDDVQDLTIGNLKINGDDKEHKIVLHNTTNYNIDTELGIKNEE